MKFYRYLLAFAIAQGYLHADTSIPDTGTDSVQGNLIATVGMATPPVDDAEIMSPFTNDYIAPAQTEDLNDPVDKGEQLNAPFDRTALNNESLQLIKKIDDSWNTQRMPDSIPLDPATPEDIKRFKELITLGADVDIQEPNGDTPLIATVKLNDLDLVQFVMDYGADVNRKGYWGHTPLMYAADNNNFEIAKLLIKHKADVNAQLPIGGGTTLQTATRNQNIPLVKLLLQKGANPNIKGTYDERPLDIAQEHNNQDLIDLLILHKAESEPHQPRNNNEMLYSALAINPAA